MGSNVVRVIHEYPRLRRWGYQTNSSRSTRGEITHIAQNNIQRYARSSLAGSGLATWAIFSRFLFYFIIFVLSSFPLPLSASQTEEVERSDSPMSILDPVSGAFFASAALDGCAARLGFLASSVAWTKFEVL